MVLNDDDGCIYDEHGVMVHDIASAVDDANAVGVYSWRLWHHRLRRREKNVRRRRRHTAVMVGRGVPGRRRLETATPKRSRSGSKCSSISTALYFRPT